jgi:hypothetical protein
VVSLALGFLMASAHSCLLIVVLISELLGSLVFSNFLPLEEDGADTLR